MNDIVCEQVKVRILPDGRVSRRNSALYLGRSQKTLADWHTKNMGPPSRLVGGRRFYHIDDLRAFAEGEAA